MPTQFEQGKMEGFSTACQLVESHWRLTQDIKSILSLWRYYVRIYVDDEWTFHTVGYLLGIRLALVYFTGLNEWEKVNA